jgi:Mrp family chromosome partitioning ATPase
MVLLTSCEVAYQGVAIVSTPQDIALIDAVRGINMFRKVQVPVLFRGNEMVNVDSGDDREYGVVYMSSLSSYNFCIFIGWC